MDDRAGQLPQGTASFVFTDIEGSTGLAEALGATWPSVLVAHRAEP